MNHAFPFLLPLSGVFGRECTQTNSIPAPITQEDKPQQPPLPQSTTINSPPLSTNNQCNSTTNPTSQIQGIPQPSNKNIQPNNIPGVVNLHHQESSNLILESYCLPVSDTFSTSLNKCKYNPRECVVAKTNLLYKGQNIASISPTVFRNYTRTTKKFTYRTMDTRFVSCFNKLCKQSNSQLPKCFHYVCFQHMMVTRPKDGIDVLEITGPGDKLIEQIDKSVDIRSIQNTIATNNTKLIFPVCGKRCYNTVEHLRNKKDTKSHSEYASAQSWDNDGTDTHRSSIDILIGWLTTEENATKYFGGLDTDGRTSSNRKESYHHLIRDLIKNENGE